MMEYYLLCVLIGMLIGLLIGIFRVGHLWENSIMNRFHIDRITAMNVVANELKNNKKVIN